MPYYDGYPFRFGAAPCCCPDCWRFLDEFDREDSTELGDNWNESEGQANGDWGIEDERLVEKYGAEGGTADAVVFCKRRVPDRSRGEMYVFVDVIGASMGDVFRIYPCCPAEDEKGPVTCEYTMGAEGMWIVKIIASGVEEESVQMLASPIAVDTVRLYACADHKVSMVLAGVVSDRDPSAWADSCDPGDGPHAALGHDNVENGAVFDDFNVGELRKYTKLCYSCWCTCQGYPPKKVLHAQFYAAVDRSNCLNGLTWEMTWQWNAGVPRWFGQVDIPATESGGESATWQFELVCTSGADENNPNWPGKNFTLRKLMPLGYCGTSDPLVANQSSSSCHDDLTLQFGPWLMTNTDLACRQCYLPLGGPVSGTYYVVITE